MRFSDSYLPSEFLAFRQRLVAQCNRLRWDRTDRDNFAVRIIGSEVCDDLDKFDWEHLLACMEDLPTPPPLNGVPGNAPQRATPDATLLAFVQMASSEELRSLYRAMSKRMHPDAGGDTATMQKLNLIWERLETKRG